MSERNWAGNYTYRASSWHRPTSIDQLRSIVAAAPRIGVVGSRHSFNGLGDNDELIDLGLLPTWCNYADGADEITFAGHTTYAEVATALDHFGLALANLASLPHLSVAGAIATGTHGSGSTNANLATAVRGLGLIDADGGRRLVGPGAAIGLEAGVVAMGRLGIVESVTLAVEPTYEVAQFVYEDLSWDVIVDSFDDLFASAYSVSVFSRLLDRPEQIWSKFRSDDERVTKQGSSGRFGGRLAARNRHPILSLPADSATEQGGRAGPWHERLPHFRASFQPSAGEEIQTEFFVRLSDGAPALEALRQIGPELAEVLLVSEIRTVAADSLWMSPAYRRESAAFHFTWRRDPEAVDRAVALVESALAPFEPRPHWGKVFHPEAFDVAASYDRFGDFTEVLDANDPDRCFANDWSARVLGR